jgi:DNA-binding beta-propeller fold protein YncE
VAGTPFELGAVAINRTTNKIYATGGTSAGVVTVVDGKTLSTMTLTAGPMPVAIAINEATNKIYVANHGGLYHGEIFLGNGSITVIDGATNSTATVTDPNAKFPCAVAVNPLTNKIYVANNDFGSVSVTIIDGATNSTKTVTDPNASGSELWMVNSVAVNPVPCHRVRGPSRSSSCARSSAKNSVDLSVYSILGGRS